MLFGGSDDLDNLKGPKGFCRLGLKVHWLSTVGVWFLGKGGGVLAQGGVTGSCAQNKDWFPEWESAGGGKANPALLPLALEGLQVLVERKMEQTFRLLRVSARIGG